MKYLNGKKFKYQDYRYGAWFYDPIVKLFRSLLRLDKLPIAVVVQNKIPKAERV